MNQEIKNRPFVNEEFSEASSPDDQLLKVTIGEGVTAVGEWTGCSEVRGGSRRRRLSMGLPRMASVSPLAFITLSPRNTSKSQAYSYVDAKSFQRLHPHTHTHPPALSSQCVLESTHGSLKSIQMQMRDSTTILTRWPYTKHSH